MTLGILVPLVLLIIGFAETVLFLRWLSVGRIKAGAAYLMIALTLALPVVAYVVLTFVIPDLGARSIL